MAGNFSELIEYSTSHIRSQLIPRKIFFQNPQLDRSHENNVHQEQRKTFKWLEKNDRYLLTSYGLSSQQPR